MQQRINQLESMQYRQNAAINHVNVKTQQTDFTSKDLLKTNTKHSDMFNNLQNDVTGKALRQLEMQRDGTLTSNGVYWGGVLKGSFMGEWTDTEDKFAILSRFPGQHSGSSGSRFVINQATLSATAAMHDWVTGTMQLEYTETEYPGQSDLNMRKAFVTVGNLKESPWYASFGRNTIDFGNMDSYNPFTHTTTNHYFHAQSTDPTLAIGYANYGWHVVATAINGGRQQRVAHHEDSNHVKNFALKAEKAFTLGEKSMLQVGASYLHSSIYNSVTPHHTATDIAAADDQVHRNGIWNVFAEMQLQNWMFMVEFTRTLRDWPAVDEPVWALTAQAEYFFDNWGRPASVSFVYGHGDQGRSGDEWEFMRQVILGYETQVNSNFYLGAEYVHNHGFAPLINITQTSDQSVDNHSLILGGRFVF